MKNKNKRFINSGNFHLKMGQKLLYSIVIILVICTSLVSAAPGIPHQFYGNVKVNNNPVPDNTVIVATVEGDTYTTITTDSKYGYSPNIFYVEDPDGDRAGSIIFSIGGKEVGNYTFENNGYTKLDFSLTTYCGDLFCLGDETCSTCPGDCGFCTGPPVITIHSPIEGQTYDTTKIDLDVSADQEIIVWMYSLNSATPITFTPNITITAQEGNNSINIIGINSVYQSGTKTVSFSVELPQPYCGDGNKDANEECDGSNFGTQTCSSYGFNSGSLTCTANCTINSSACYNSGSSGGGGGGGGGVVSSVCTPIWDCTEWTICSQAKTQTRTCTYTNNCGIVTENPVEIQTCNYVPPKTTKTQEEEPEPTSGEDEPAPTEEPPVTGTAVTEPIGGFGRITGMFFQNITGANKWKGLGVIILVLLVGYLFYFFVLKKKRKKE